MLCGRTTVTLLGSGQFRVRQHDSTGRTCVSGISSVHGEHLRRIVRACVVFECVSNVVLHGLKENAGARQRFFIDGKS